MERKFILTESQLLERDRQQREICYENWLEPSSIDILSEKELIINAPSPSLEGLQEWKEEEKLWSCNKCDSTWYEAEKEHLSLCGTCWDKLHPSA